MITAAHCVEKYPFASQWKIKAGHIKRSRHTSSGEQIKRVRRLKIHKEYNKADDGTSHPYNNDIAVMITDPFIMTEYVRPACLPPKGFTINEGFGVISGFGSTQSGGSILSYPMIHM